MPATPRPKRPRITRRVLDTLDTALGHYRANLEAGATNAGAPQFADLFAALTWIQGMKACIKPVQRRKRP